MGASQYFLSGLTVAIGIFVAFVGYQQFRVQKARFKLDLFENTRLQEVFVPYLGFASWS